MACGMVLNIQRHSVHDGPGVRTTVFLKGCPLRCVWCCNPESQHFGQEYMFVETRCIGCNACGRVCPENACRDGHIDYTLCKRCGLCVKECYAGALKPAGTRMSVKQVMDEIAKDDLYYEKGGGVTVSGGEAFAQPEFLGELLFSCKKEGLHTLVETCGYFDWEACKMAIDCTDQIYFDMKHCDDENYRKYTGAAMGPVIGNLKRLLAENKKVTVRIPVILGYNGEGKTLEKMADILRECGYEGEIHLLPYHAYGSVKYRQLGRDYMCQEARRPDKEDMEGFAFCLEKKGFPVVCYG